MSFKVLSLNIMNTFIILKKKFALGLFSVFIALAAVFSLSVTAQACELEDNSILGIPTWYKYLDGELVPVIARDAEDGSIREVEVCQPVLQAESGQSIPTKDILLIVAAVLDILIRIAGLAAFIFLLYGGFMYLTSSGEAENTKKAGQTLLNAAIGLAIAISATAIVNFVARSF